MDWRGADEGQLLRREVARLRDFLERIVEVAHNPDCLACAEVRRLGREGLKPNAPLDNWQT